MVFSVLGGHVGCQPAFGYYTKIRNSDQRDNRTMHIFRIESFQK